MATVTAAMRTTTATAVAAAAAAAAATTITAAAVTATAAGTDNNQLKAVTAMANTKKEFDWVHRGIIQKTICAPNPKIQEN